MIGPMVLVRALHVFTELVALMLPLAFVAFLPIPTVLRCRALPANHFWRMIKPLGLGGGNTL